MPKRVRSTSNAEEKDDEVKKQKRTTKRRKNGARVSEKKTARKPAKKARTDDAKLQHVKAGGKRATQTKTYSKEIDPKTNEEQDPSEIQFTAALPSRNAKGELVFEGFADFRPNMTPKEVLQAGSFGGTYFRPIASGVTGKKYSGVWKELPKDWLEGLNIGTQVSSPVYNEKVNTYNVKSGGSLDMWESSGWIHKQDPYGWFQWYCRFYQGRRSADDSRQIGRWLRCAGTTGRWRNSLAAKCVRSNARFDNHTVSPVIRQTLQHWGYRLTQEHYDAYRKKHKA